MSRAARRIISANPNHPLRFLLDRLGRFMPQQGLTHDQLINRPDIVQMGHIESAKRGQQERLMLQGAWENQFNNITIEGPRVGGSVIDQVAIDIGGIAVDIKTAQFWEDIGWLPPGTVGSAPVVE